MNTCGCFRLASMVIRIVTKLLTWISFISEENRRNRTACKYTHVSFCRAMDHCWKYTSRVRPMKWNNNRQKQKLEKKVAYEQQYPKTWTFPMLWNHNNWKLLAFRKNWATQTSHVPLSLVPGILNGTTRNAICTEKYHNKLIIYYIWICFARIGLTWLW